MIITIVVYRALAGFTPWTCQSRNREREKKLSRAVI